MSLFPFRATLHIAWHTTWALPVLAATACASAEPAATAASTEPVKYFATAPVLPAGHKEFIFPETTIAAGKEVQNCYFVEPLAEDVYYTALESYQGKFGHHAVLFKTSEPEKPGTVRDCTSAEDMIKLSPVMASVNFGLAKFPAGMAVRVKKGTQLVVQQHYVNTGTKAIRVKDILHVKQVTKAEVQTLAGFYGTSDITFVLKPSDAEQTLTYECKVPRDMKLLMIGPHMHEWGLRFKAEAGPEGAMKTLLDINPWKAEYRDEPPVKEFKVGEAYEFKKGDVLKTSCVYKNNTGKALEFPGEMCATYGYYFPAPEGNEEWTCGSVGKIQ
ncbi:MAG: hypothetical protein EXR79_10655 [Myxococcales bacterium]|nr:hypothetical protein [Myxococcales bacterium]